MLDIKRMQFRSLTQRGNEEYRYAFNILTMKMRSCYINHQQIGEPTRRLTG